MDDTEIMKTSTESRSYWPIISLVMLILLGLINLYALLFYAPRSRDMYHDIFPGVALPKMTRFMLAAHWPLALGVLAWVSAAIVGVKRRHPLAIYVVGIGQFLFLVFLAILAYALIYLPASSVANGSMGEPYIP